MKNLNKNQIKAVTTVDGPVQVISCAGSGKTRVLTYRIEYMINSLNINPSNMFVSTFTKKSAEEMTERLSKLLKKEQLNKLTIGTFHSIGYSILKDYYRQINSPMKNFKLIKSNETKTMIRNIINDFKMNYSDNYIINKINKLKIQLISPEQYMINILAGDNNKVSMDFFKIYKEYEARKTQNLKIDFNDMLYQTYFSFFENNNFLQKYQDKFKYLLVDEAQDNNYAQYKLIELLAYPQNNIFLVGDDDQSIYGFRGAKPQEFINFDKNFDNVQKINLDINYRSNPQILNIANKLISKNKFRMQKEIKPFITSKNNSVNHINLEDETKEAEYISNQIDKLYNNNHDLNNIAVIYRTNAQARSIEDQLILKNIPYHILNGISFYEREEIKDIIAYLKLATNNDDDESFKRIINKPTRYLGKKFLYSVAQIAKKNNISLYEALSHNELEIKAYQRRNVIKFKQMINDIELLIDKFNSSEIWPCDILLSEIVGLTKYIDFLQQKSGSNDKDNNKIENIHSLIFASSKYKNINQLINYVDLIANKKNKKSFQSVKLMTIHKSKGLEFDSVFLIGMVERLLPHSYAISNTSTSELDIEEERRLAYVAITRAKNNLTLTSPLTYLGNRCETSRFVFESGIMD